MLSTGVLLQAVKPWMEYYFSPQDLPAGMDEPLNLDYENADSTSRVEYLFSQIIYFFFDNTCFLYMVVP